MPFQKIDSEKLSKSVVRQVEQLILRGILRPGERLPSERELAEKLAVSRPSLREALSELQQAGLLTARAGAGIFVAEVLGSAFSPALMRLFSTHDEAVYDYLAFRKDLEGLAAERAARIGSDTDLKVINAIYEKMEAAQSKRSTEEEARLDAQFHMSICDPSAQPRGSKACGASPLRFRRWRFERTGARQQKRGGRQAALFSCVRPPLNSPRPKLPPAQMRRGTKKAQGSHLGLFSQFT